MLNSGDLGMKERAEFAGRLSGAGFKNPAQVTLIREAGIACNIRKIGPARGQGAAGILHPQTVCEFRHGAAIVFAKYAR